MEPEDRAIELACEVENTSDEAKQVALIFAYAEEIRRETSRNLRDQRDELLHTLRIFNDAINTVGWDYIDSSKLCKLLDQVLIKYKEV